MHNKEKLQNGQNGKDVKGWQGKEKLQNGKSEKEKLQSGKDAKEREKKNWRKKRRCFGA